MNCISHGSHKSLGVQGRLWVLTCGYINLCYSLRLMYTDTWVVGTQELAHFSACVSVWYASSQQAAEKSPFFIFLSLLNLPASLLWSP